MKREEMTRLLLETAVDKGINDIERDCNRSLRKLVDLGAHFSSSRFQKEFFLYTQQLLRNEQSPCYSLIKRIVADCDHETVKRFGINLGYNSWTRGARTIRALEGRLGFNIPWEITLQTSGKDGSQLSFDRLDAIVQEGRELGIFTYILGGAQVLDISLTLLFSRYTDCAFFLLLPPGAINDASLAQISDCRNLMVCLNTEEEGFEAAAKALHARRCIYSAHRFYNDGDADAIVSGEWAQRAIDAGCVAGVLVCGAHCSQTTAGAVQKYARDELTGQQSPVFISELFADSLSIDEVISADGRFLGIDSHGRAVTLSAGKHAWVSTGEVVEKGSLQTVLSRVMPKASGGAKD